MNINEKNLVESGLDPNSYLVLFSLNHQIDSIIIHMKNLKLYDSIIKDLEERGYLKITGEDSTKNFVLRQKALSLFGKKDDVIEWYEQWRNLFPEGINRSGYYYRGNKQEVLKKLTKFRRENPQYSKEQIFNATQRYINRCTRSGAYMLQAHYFIEKEGVGSTLATELESNTESNDTTRTSGIELPGQSIL